MILKGSQRAGGKQLASHLLKTSDNEHVQLHELRGFLATDLHAAMQEAHAISQGTRAKQFLFSLSLNPPPNERVPVAVFESAVERIEQRLGLEGQPRAIVFHEKEGRRHCHTVWSRIDPVEMKAINLPHFGLKLRDLSREIYMEMGWKMPGGYLNSEAANPLNFTREQWQQSQRTRIDPRAVKALFQECWAVSDSTQAFAQVLAERGYYLAKGDRRAFVALDYRGEIYSVSRYVGIKAKDVEARLGNLEELPSVEKTLNDIAEKMSGALRRHIERSQVAFKEDHAKLSFRRAQLVQQQRAAREEQRQKLEARWNAENAARAQRFSHGFKGLWHRVTGQHARIRRQNEYETARAEQRDTREKEDLIARQLDERKGLHAAFADLRKAHSQDAEQLQREVATYLRMSTATPEPKHDFNEAARHEKPTLQPGFNQQAGMEPDL